MRPPKKPGDQRMCSGRELTVPAPLVTPVVLGSDISYSYEYADEYQ